MRGLGGGVQMEHPLGVRRPVFLVVEEKPFVSLNNLSVLGLYSPWLSFLPEQLRRGSTPKEQTPQADLKLKFLSSHRQVINSVLSFFSCGNPNFLELLGWRSPALISKGARIPTSSSSAGKTQHREVWPDMNRSAQAFGWL